jgi:hypothetical protein
MDPDTALARGMKELRRRGVHLSWFCPADQGGGVGGTTQIKSSYPGIASWPAEVSYVTEVSDSYPFSGPVGILRVDVGRGRPEPTAPASPAPSDCLRLG